MIIQLLFYFDTLTNIILNYLHKMNSLKKIMITITLLLSIVVANAQIKNAKTENVKVYGNCEMCETKIEKAGNLKKTAKVDWNADTKMATITYDAQKTNQDEILKRIALAGYDSDTFLAPDAVYAKLHGCCKYDRDAKIPANADATTPVKKEMNKSKNSVNIENQSVNQLKSVFDKYFLLKDALVKTDGNSASANATELLSAISTVKMETLKMDEHMVWMKVFQNLTNDAKNISKIKDIEKQRSFFNALSKGIYELIKVSKSAETIYYQYCPMKKMNWLSKENTIKNPYYGSQMLSCGSVVETIK